RAGDWKAAVAALDKSVELRQGGDAMDRLFLAMAHRKLGDPDEARKAYDLALQWLEKNKEPLEKDKGRAAEPRLLRAEAEQVLELKQKCPRLARTNKGAGKGSASGTLGPFSLRRHAPGAVRGPAGSSGSGGPTRPRSRAPRRRSPA